MKNNSPLKLGAIYAFVFLFFFLFNVIFPIGLSPKETVIILLFASIISLIGLFILYFKKDNDPQKNTFRLLIMISVQLLSFLTVSLAMIYTKQSKVFILTFLALCLCLIIAQTIFLVRSLKSPDEG